MKRLAFFITVLLLGNSLWSQDRLYLQNGTELSDIRIHEQRATKIVYEHAGSLHDVPISEVVWIMRGETGKRILLHASPSEPESAPPELVAQTNPEVSPPELRAAMQEATPTDLPDLSIEGEDIQPQAEEEAQEAEEQAIKKRRIKRLAFAAVAVNVLNYLIILVAGL